MMVPQTTSTNYQEEICERLIQLSFAKIVNSKNERGGARLRKNLLILHLLQKARTEQRTRLHVAATPMDSSSIDNEEKTAYVGEEDACRPVDNNVRTNNVVDAVDNGCNGRGLFDEEEENNSVDASLQKVGLTSGASSAFNVDLMELDKGSGGDRGLYDSNSYNNHISDNCSERVIQTSIVISDSQGVQQRQEDDISSSGGFYVNELQEREIDDKKNIDSGPRRRRRSSDDEESSSDTDDSDSSACSDDDASSPPCARCTSRKRKLTEGSEANGVVGGVDSSLNSNKRSCGVSSAQQLQGLISVFKNGLSGMSSDDDDAENVSPVETNQQEQQGSDESASAATASSFIVGSRQQNNLNHTISCTTVWELACAS